MFYKDRDIVKRKWNRNKGHPRIGKESWEMPGELLTLHRILRNWITESFPAIFKTEREQPTKQQQQQKQQQHKKKSLKRKCEKLLGSASPVDYERALERILPRLEEKSFPLLIMLLSLLPRWRPLESSSERRVAPHWTSFNKSLNEAFDVKFSPIH